MSCKQSTLCAREKRMQLHAPSKLLLSCFFTDESAEALSWPVQCPEILQAAGPVPKLTAVAVTAGTVKLQN